MFPTKVLCLCLIIFVLSLNICIVTCGRSSSSSSSSGSRSSSSGSSSSSSGSRSSSSGSRSSGYSSSYSSRPSSSSRSSSSSSSPSSGHFAYKPSTTWHMPASSSFSHKFINQDPSSKTSINRKSSFIPNTAPLSKYYNTNTQRPSTRVTSTNAQRPRISNAGYTARPNIRHRTLSTTRYNTTGGASRYQPSAPPLSEIHRTNDKVQKVPKYNVSKSETGRISSSSHTHRPITHSSFNSSTPTLTGRNATRPIPSAPTLSEIYKPEEKIQKAPNIPLHNTMVPHSNQNTSKTGSVVDKYAPSAPPLENNDFQRRPSAPPFNATLHTGTAKQTTILTSQQNNERMPASNLNPVDESIKKNMGWSVGSQNLQTTNQGPPAPYPTTPGHLLQQPNNQAPLLPHPTSPGHLPQHPSNQGPALPYPTTPGRLPQQPIQTKPNPIGWNVSHGVDGSIKKDVGWNVNNQNPQLVMNGPPASYPGHLPPPYISSQNPHVINPGSPPTYPGHLPPSTYPGHFPPATYPGHLPQYSSMPSQGHPPPYYTHYPYGTNYPGYRTSYPPPPPPPGYSYQGYPMFQQNKENKHRDLLLGVALWQMSRKSKDHHHHHYHLESPGYSSDFGYPPKNYNDYQQQYISYQLNYNPRPNVLGAHNTVAITYFVSNTTTENSTVVGTMACRTTYNLRAVRRWANITMKDFYKQFPHERFPELVNGSLANYTVVPGKIIHNETALVTCCGTNGAPMELNLLTNGKSRHVNCLNMLGVIPFRKITFIKQNSSSISNTTNSANVNVTTPNPFDGPWVPITLINAYNKSATPAQNSSDQFNVTVPRIFLNTSEIPVLITNTNNTLTLNNNLNNTASASESLNIGVTQNPSELIIM